LEALEIPWNAPYVDGCDLALGKKVKAITAIKEALAQPEQEPVAVYRSGQAKGEVYHVQFFKEMAADEVLLYAAPVQRAWTGLTDEEVMAIAFNFDVPSLVIRTVETKLKEKNT
jgi:hypothetical protein